MAIVHSGLVPVLADNGPYITGSMIPAIMGSSPWQTRQELLDEMRGVLPPQTKDFVKKRSEISRPYAIEAFEREFGLTLNRQYFAVHEGVGCAEFGASLDGIGMDESDNTVVVRITVPGEKTLKEASQGIVAPHYQDHLQWLIACAGTQFAILWVWDCNLEYGTALTVHRDPKRIAELEEAARTFRTVLMGTTEEGPSLLCEAMAEEVAEKMRAIKALEAEVHALNGLIEAEMTATATTEWRHGGLEFAIKPTKPTVKTDWKGLVQSLKLPNQTALVQGFSKEVPPIAPTTFKVDWVKQKKEPPPAQDTPEKTKAPLKKEATAEV
jgi:putative phage-type endonuclease